MRPCPLVCFPCPGAPGQSLSLLEREISRVKIHIGVQGASPALLERLKHLEALLETCLRPL